MFNNTIATISRAQSTRTINGRIRHAQKRSAEPPWTRKQRRARRRPKRAKRLRYIPALRSFRIQHTVSTYYSHARACKVDNRFPSTEGGEDKDDDLDDVTSSDSEEGTEEEEDDSCDNNKSTGAKSESSANPVDIEAGRLAFLTLVCCWRNNLESVDLILLERHRQTVWYLLRAYGYGTCAHVNMT